MKVVMTQAVCPEGMKLLEGRAEIYVADKADPNDYLDEMSDADALIVRIAKCDGEVIEHSPNLKVIGRTGVGYDNVDVKKATEKGIPVVITPGANDRSVAEHAVALMFALSKNLYEGHQEMMSGNWEIRGARKAFELEGKTIGFIGLGAIGKETLKICKAIGMKTAGYDPFLTQEQVIGLGADYYDNYKDMLVRCDVLSIHVPLTKHTKNMITENELELMKPSALLINCSRGGIVNEMDLAKALDNGKIAGAGLDVFEEEPPRLDSRILRARNVIVSPHSAAQTREAVIHMATMCIRGCLAVLSGEKWPYVANPEVYENAKWR